jgi:hypothetical protein
MVDSKYWDPPFFLFKLLLSNILQFLFIIYEG